MNIPAWRGQQSGHAKTVAVLAVLLVLELGLCAVLPTERELPVGGVILVIVFIGTAALLMVVVISWVLRLLLSGGNDD